MEQKKEKIFFIGNQDNIGFLFCKEARRRGYRAYLSMRARNIPRSEPDMLKPGEYERNKEWITLNYNEFLKMAEKLENVTLISSGIEIQDLLRVSNTNAIKILLPTGSDLGMWPFVDEKTALAPNYLRFREIFYKHRFEIDKIFTGQHDNINACRVLGIADKLHSNYFTSLPTEYMEPKPSALFKNIKQNRIFFNPGRKNGDPNYTHYKGVEKLPKAYEIALSKLSKKEIANICIVNSLHGNQGISYTYENFKHECDAVFEKFDCPNLYVKNLPVSQLWELFQNEKVICLDQFGQYHGVLGGCAREAMYYGAPTITGSLGRKDYLVGELYGSEPYVFEAHSTEEISDCITKLARMPDDRFKQCREMTKAWTKLFTLKENRDCIFDCITTLRKEKQK